MFFNSKSLRNERKKNHPLRDCIESRGFIQRRVLFFLYILHFVFYAKILCVFLCKMKYCALITVVSVREFTPSFAKGLSDAILVSYELFSRISMQRYYRFLSRTLFGSRILFRALPHISAKKNI